MSSNVTVVLEEVSSFDNLEILWEVFREVVPVLSSHHETIGLLMRFVNYLASSIVATFESTDNKCVMNSYFELINSVDLVTNVDFTLHHKNDHINTI